MKNKARKDKYFEYVNRFGEDVNCNNESRAITYAASEVAKTLEITAPRLSEILNGKKDPTYKQAQKIATTLKIDANIVLAI